MKKRSVSLIIAMFWLAPAWAAPVPSQPKIEPDEPAPVEQILDQLAKQKKSKPALLIKRVYDALGAKQFSKAKTLAAQLKGDKLFGDYAPGLTADALLSSSRAKLDHKNWAEAETEATQGIHLLSELDLQFPYSRFRRQLPDKIAALELVVGDSFAARKKWERAEFQYEAAFVRVNSEKLIALLTMTNIENYSKSCVKRFKPYCTEWLRRLIELYPKASSEEIRVNSIISENIELNRVEKSDRSYERLTAPYKVPDADLAAVDDAIKLYLSGDRSGARDKLQDFFKDYPRSGQRSRARYWLAQILTKDGKKDDPTTRSLYEEILKESPTSYYGLLAALATGRALDSMMEEYTPQGVREEIALDARESQRLEKGEKLFVAGALEAAREELKDLTVRPLHSSEFLIYLAALQAKVGNDLQAFATVGELIQRKQQGVYAGYMIQVVFPVRYENLIERTAQQFSLDPVLVMSLIKQESAFNPEAVSTSGALGLMQIMPFTITALDDKVEMVKSSEPEANIKLGSKYIAELLKRYAGNLTYVLSAYNAGPSHLDQWRHDAKPEWGMLEFIESIPYRETREYVSSIIRHFVWYSYLLHGTKTQSLEYFWQKQGPQESPPPTPNPSVSTLRTKSHASAVTR